LIVIDSRPRLRTTGLLAALLSVVLAACSSAGSSPSPAASAASAAPASGASSAGASASAPAASEAAPSGTAVASGSAPASGSSAAPGASGSAAAVNLPPPETTKLTIGLSNNLAVGQFLDRFAQDTGIFQKYGLDVNVIPFEGDGKLTQAVFAGQVQGAESSGGAAISASLTDTPLIVTTLNSVALPYELIGAKDIKTPADLKGKIIGVSSLGSTAHAVVLQALKDINVSPTEVTISPVGSESARIAAVVGGSIAAAPVTKINAEPLLQKGLNVLDDLTTKDIEYAAAGLTFQKDWLAQNPNTALRVIAAILEAQKLAFDNPDLAAQKYADFTQASLDVARAQVADYNTANGNKGLRFTESAFEIVKEVTVSVNPRAADVDLKTVFDLSYLDKLQQLGFNDAIGWP
jgi:NitT/TauT family transport system substrate-binding protein